MVEVDHLTTPKPELSDKEARKTSKKKSGFKFNLIVIIASQLVLAAGGFFMVSQFIKPDPAYRQALEETQTVAEEETEAGATSSDAPREIHLIEDVIVNPAGTRGSRYLSVSIGVEMNGSESGGGKEGGHGEAAAGTASPLEARKIQLRDALINILSSKTILELTTLEEKEKIRQEILTRFSEILQPETVHQIYFVDFVLQ